ncbi:MAG TPA: GNAT family N-acetyltransferase [Hyphomonadaceae bacterium]|nr:GNAT family N-acetyltransferase [Hyphomonadaceae bacterium]
MTQTVDIRPATEADLDTITAIYAHAVLNGTASYEYDAPSRDEMGSRYASLMAGRFPYIVAQTGTGAVAGYAYAGPFRTRPAYRFTVEDSIYLSPDWQGRGIGKLLLERLIRESEARGARQMIAVIGDAGVNLASARLHAAMGFTHCGRIEGSGFKFGRWCDTLMMQRPLNGGATTLPSG